MGENILIMLTVARAGTLAPFNQCHLACCDQVPRTALPLRSMAPANVSDSKPRESAARAPVPSLPFAPLPITYFFFYLQPPCKHRLPPRSDSAPLKSPKAKRNIICLILGFSQASSILSSALVFNRNAILSL